MARAQASVTCTFCEIVAGRLPAAVVLRRDGLTAFLDTKPVFPGHVLIVPDVHVVTLVDAAPATVATLFAAVRAVAGAVVTALGAEGSFVAVNNVVSQSVPHLHAHVVPRRKGDGLKGFFWPRTRYPDDAAREDVRARLAAALPPPPPPTTTTTT